MSESISVDEYKRLTGQANETSNRVYHEDNLQTEVAAMLQAASFETAVIWYHIPNQRSSKVTVGQIAKLQRMGMKAGAPDLVFHWTDHVERNGERIFYPTVGFIELKYGKNKQSVKQIAFENDCQRMNIPYRVCRSWDEVKVALKNWGLL